MAYTIKDYSIADSATDHAAIKTALDGYDPVPSITAITAGVKAEANPAAREIYLRSAYTALGGDPTEINAESRFDSIVVLHRIREAKRELDRNLPSGAENMRLRVVGIVGDCFKSRDNLIDFAEFLVSGSNSEAVTGEVERIAARLVGDLDDSGSVLTVADLTERIGFVAPASLTAAIGNAFVKQAVGITP